MCRGGLFFCLCGVMLDFLLALTTGDIHLDPDNHQNVPAKVNSLNDVCAACILNL